MKESYAQVGEDLIVDHYLKEQDKGTYVDIGAYEPIFLSNTYKFYKRGWRGICVEPNNLKIQKFQEDRPEDTFFNEACGDQDLTFNLSPLHDSLSSCGKGNGVPIKSRLLTEYLSMLPEVDLLSIDCEGMELEILKSNDWTLYRPKVIIAEIIDYEKKTKNEELISYLKEQGYGVIGDTQINIVMLEEKLYNPIFKTTLR